MTTNVVKIEDWLDDMELAARMTESREHEARRQARVRRHRLARQWLDAALIGAAFAAGIAVGAIVGVL